MAWNVLLFDKAQGKEDTNLLRRNQSPLCAEIGANWQRNRSQCLASGSLGKNLKKKKRKEIRNQHCCHCSKSALCVGGQCEALITICELLLVRALSTCASHSAPEWVFIAHRWMWAPGLCSSRCSEVFSYQVDTARYSDHTDLSRHVQADEFQFFIWKARNLTMALPVASFHSAVMSSLLSQNCVFLWPAFRRFVTFHSFKGSKGIVYLDLRKLNILNPAAHEKNIGGWLFTLQKDSQWDSLSCKYYMWHLACDLGHCFRSRSIGNMQSI